MSPSALAELEEKTQELVPLSSARALVDSIYALDASTWTDEEFAVVERLIDQAIQLFAALPTAERRPLIERLLIAREGVEQGLDPDPSKRPSKTEMREFVSAHLD